MVIPADLDIETETNAFSNWFEVSKPLILGEDPHRAWAPANGSGRFTVGWRRGTRTPQPSGGFLIVIILPRLHATDAGACIHQRPIVRAIRIMSWYLVYILLK